MGLFFKTFYGFYIKPDISFINFSYALSVSDFWLDDEDGLDGPIRAADDEDVLGRRDEGTKPRLVGAGRDVIDDWPPDPRRAVGINDVANPK